MRKMKKINGYLVVKFNARELREYEGAALGEYGVIDAELYTGILDVDRGAMEYRTTARSGRPTLTATCGSLGSTGGRSTSSPQRPVKTPRSPQETRTESRESNSPGGGEKAKRGAAKAAPLGV